MSKEMIELADKLAKSPDAEYFGLTAYHARDLIEAALRASAVVDSDRLVEPITRALLVHERSVAGSVGSVSQGEARKAARKAADIAAAIAPLVAHPAPAAPVPPQPDWIAEVFKPLPESEAAILRELIWDEDEAPAAPVPASVREALDEIFMLSGTDNDVREGASAVVSNRLNRIHALASLPAPEAAPTITKNDFIRQGIAQFKEHELREIVAVFCKLPGIAPEAAPTREEYAAVLAQELWCGATFADAAPSEREAFLRAVDAILALKAAPAK